MPTYHRPASLEEACSLLAELGPEALALAGGTDIVPDIRRGAKRPQHLVSLRDLSELRGIRIEGEEIRIGALSTVAEIRAADPLEVVRPELLEAIEVFASPQIRSRATIGGNLCTAASCSDLVPLLMAVGSRVQVVGPDGERDISLEDFFEDVRVTALGPGEIVVDVVVPVRKSGEGACYETFGLRAAAFITVAGVAAAVKVDGETCRSARVVLSAVAPTPVLVPKAGEILIESSLEDAALAAAGRAAREAARPISDIRGSAEHRRELVEVLTVRALHIAGDRARGRVDQGEGS